MCTVALGGELEVRRYPSQSHALKCRRTRTVCRLATDTAESRGRMVQFTIEPRV